MSIIVILLPLAFLLALTFVVSFVWSVNEGQYDDLETASQKILLDDIVEREKR